MSDLEQTAIERLKVASDINAGIMNRLITVGVTTTVGRRRREHGET